MQNHGSNLSYMRAVLRNLTTEMARFDSTRTAKIERNLKTVMKNAVISAPTSNVAYPGKLPMMPEIVNGMHRFVIQDS